jgi:hypothetical protein
MPISKVEVNEYQCILCKYRWINRINGKDGGIPQRCAKCKSYSWNGVRRNLISPKERGLRKRIKALPRLYWYQYYYYSKHNEPKRPIEECFDCELLARFLILDNPRPTIPELIGVLYPKGIWRKLSSKNQFRRRGWVPNPDRAGYLKYDKEAYLKLISSEAERQQQAIREILEKYESNRTEQKGL